MLQECPHCHTLVLPKQDGKCPSCQKYFSDTSGIDANIKLIELKHRSTLPPICINCGKPTDRTVILEEGVEKGGDSWLNKIFMSRSLLIQGQVYAVEMSIPQCKECAKLNGKPKPERVNFEDGSMSFLVHVEFYNKIMGRELQKSKPPQSDTFFRMKVDDVYTIRSVGISVTGKIESGALRVGDEIHLLDKELDKKIIVGGILVSHKQVDEASANMKVEIQIQKLEKDDIKRGNILTG